LFEAGADLFCKDNVRKDSKGDLHPLSLTLSTAEFCEAYRLLRRGRLRCTDGDIDGLRLLLSDLSDSLLSRLLPSSLLSPRSCQHYQQHRKPWLSFYHSVHHAEKDQRPSTESQEGQNHSQGSPSERPSSVRMRAACSSLRRLGEISDVIRFVTEHM
jgi:hypothetical protein